MARVDDPGLEPTDIRDDPRLERYRVLPSEEYSALSAWASTFYPFQRDWLLDASDLAISNKARQIGLSHTSAGSAVIWGAFRGEMTTIISLGDRESTEVLSKCRAHVDILQSLGSKNAATKKSNTQEIVFASGGRILALPSSGGRSFTGNVVLDEYAYLPHATAVWDRAAPVAMHGGRIRVLSTPNGIGNEFYDLWEIATNPDRRRGMSGEAGEIRWSAHETTIEKAISQGFPVNLTKCWTEIAKGDPRLFAQMFQCSFLDNVLQYIPNEVIEACMTTEPCLAPKVGEFYGGLDIGREADLTCLVILHRVRAESTVVHIEYMKRTDSDGLEAMIDRAFARYKLTRLCIDSTGLGTFPVDRVKKKHSERIEVSHRRPRVEAVSFTPLSKEALATGLYTAMTSQVLRLPANNEALPYFSGIDESPDLLKPRPWVVNEPESARKLRKEIASIQRIVTASGNIQYTTPRTADGHADRAWALMLAVYARSATNPMIDALMSRMSA